MNDIQKEFVNYFNKLRLENNLSLQDSIRMLSKANDELAKDTIGSITIVSK